MIIFVTRELSLTDNLNLELCWRLKAKGLFVGIINMTRIQAPSEALPCFVVFEVDFKAVLPCFSSLHALTG